MIRFPHLLLSPPTHTAGHGAGSCLLQLNQHKTHNLFVPQMKIDREFWLVIMSLYYNVRGSMYVFLTLLPPPLCYFDPRKTLGAVMWYIYIYIMWGLSFNDMLCMFCCTDGILVLCHTKLSQSLTLYIHVTSMLPGRSTLCHLMLNCDWFVLAWYAFTCVNVHWTMLHFHVRLELFDSNWACPIHTRALNLLWPG